MLPAIALAKGACTLWEEELLLDYTIEVEDEQFKVHKVVMASVSDYFKAMLTGGMVESREDRVRLEGLSSLAVRNVIEFVYTGQFGASKASLDELLACSMYLQIPAAVEAVTTSLYEEVNKNNCFSILSTFKTYSLEKAIENVVTFINNDIDRILAGCKSEDMTLDEFLGFMDFWEKSECWLFVKAIQWLTKDREQRKEHVNQILSRIRFCLMSATEIVSIKRMDVYSGFAGPWHALVEKALIYHKLPTHQKVLDESEQAKVRSEPSPVCFGVRPSLSGQLFAVHRGKSWSRYDAVNPQVFSHHTECMPFSFVWANNFLIVCDRSGEHEVQFSIFDPKVLTWSAMASTGIPRVECALVYHENHLYALGGSDMRDRGDAEYPEGIDVIEKYNFHTNTWSAIDSKLPLPLVDFDAFSIGGCIYIPGGYVTEEGCDSFSNKLCCLDPQSGEWSEKNAASLSYIWQNKFIVELHGEKVLAGIDRDFRLHCYKPTTDQWLVYGQCVGSKLKLAERGLGSVLSTGNTIYFLNFALDQGEQESAEDVNEKPGACEKWTLGENGPKFCYSLNEFPIVADPNDNYCDYSINNICALLSILH